MGIRDSERHLDLNYYVFLHKYIQIKMEFLDISSLGATYHYDVNIERKFKQMNRLDFGFVNTSQQKEGKGSPNM